MRNRHFPFYRTAHVQALRHLAVLTAAATLFFIPTFLNAQDIAAGLAAYWSMDAVTGGTVADQSGNGHAGTLAGNAAIAPGGKAGGGLTAPARQTGTLYVPTLTWQPARFTIAFWINVGSNSDWSNQVISYSGWGGFVFHTTPDGGFEVGTDLANRISSWVYTGPVFLPGRWVHVAFTHDGATGSLYLDGMLRATRAMNPPAAWGGFRIGGEDSRSSLHGTIDEVRLYNRVVTPAELELLYTFPNVAATATWTGAAGTDWHTAANWSPAGVPRPIDHAVVNACTVCPALSADAEVANLTLNTGAALGLGGRTMTVAERAWLHYATVSTGGGTLRAGALPGMAGCTFDGTTQLVNATHIRGAAVSTSWHGRNTFNGPLTVTAGVPPAGGSTSGGIYDLAPGDTYNGDAVFNIHGFGMRMGFGNNGLANQFAGRLTVNYATSSSWVAGIAKGDYRGEVVLNNASAGGTLNIDGGNLFRARVSINNQDTYPGIQNDTYGNSTLVTSNCTSCANTFEGPVEVTNTSRRSDGYWAADVQYGYNGGATIFKSPVSAPPGAPALAIGPAGFLRGRLVLAGCTFENPAPMNLALSTSQTAGGLRAASFEVYNSIFAGPLTVAAPRLHFGSGVFNGEVRATKTGAGAENWGGNLFRHKLTVTNQADAASPVNMGIQADDVIDGTQ